MNQRAFLWGRILVEQPELIGRILDASGTSPPDTLEALVAARANALVAYEGKKLAAHYRGLVERAIAAETRVFGKPGRLARAVAENLFRVLAYKDEYEVARLHTIASYGPKPVFHLSPPLPLGRDPATGRRRKIALPGWAALPLFRALRHGRHLRGTVLDPFGWQKERRLERRTIRDYEADLARLTEVLSTETLEAAIQLASWPSEVRGFGPIKDEARERAMRARGKLLDRLARPTTRRAA